MPFWGLGADHLSARSLRKAGSTCSMVARAAQRFIGWEACAEANKGRGSRVTPLHAIFTRLDCVKQHDLSATMVVFIELRRIADTNCTESKQRGFYQNGNA